MLNDNFASLIALEVSLKEFYSLLNEKIFFLRKEKNPVCWELGMNPGLGNNGTCTASP
jgi:hypothetical protein